MFTIEVTIRNPQSQESKVVTRQFDPAAMTQAKWAGAFTPVIKPVIDELVASAATSEPATW